MAKVALKVYVVNRDTLRTNFEANFPVTNIFLFNGVNKNIEFIEIQKDCNEK